MFERGRQHRMLVLPAWFDEGNKLRRFTAETMRHLDGAGIDCLLPDLPGCNESLAPPEEQTLESWRVAAEAAARHFGATHILAIRASALIVLPSLPGWRYGAVAGSAQLRSLLRARVLTSREAGRAEDREELLAHGRQNGLELAGYHLGARLIADLAEAELPSAGRLRDIAQGELGGAALWLRAEPDHDPAQAERLASIVSAELLA